MQSMPTSVDKIERKPQKTGRPSKDRLFTKQSEEYLTKPRKCHDCGKLTYDYRCTDCRKKFNSRHGVVQTGPNEGDM